MADYPFLLEHGHNPSYVFRGKKADIWEGGPRVPSIVSWPEKCQSGRVCPQMVSHSDWLRTFAAILGDELPENAGEDSLSLLPLFEGEAVEVRDTIIHSSGNGSFSIRNRKWKLELCSNSGTLKPWETQEDDGTYQLYDLSEDIGERNNRIKEFPEDAEALKKTLLEQIANGRSTPGARQENYPGSFWPQLEKIQNP